MKVCTEAAAARATFLRNYGKPWEFEHNLPDDDEGRDRDPSPEKRGGETATATVTADTEGTAGRKYTPQESDPGAAHAVGAATRGETGAATTAERGAETRAGTAARNVAGAAAARRVETRRSPGDETKGEAEVGATAESAGPRPGTVKRGERTRPKRIPTAHAQQWQGLPLPPQDWQRLTGGEAWRLGPRQPHPGPHRDAAGAPVAAAGAARAANANVLEPIEEGATEV